MRAAGIFNKHFQKRFSKPLLLISLLFCALSFRAGASNYYWVGGTGNWSDLSHWATTSGGTVLQNQIPTAVDDVFFDANSFTANGQTINFDPLTILARDISFAGVTHTPTLTGSSANLLKIYGSLTFVAAMNMNFAGVVNFEATVTGKTISSAGKSFASDIVFNGIGGGWTLQDAFTAGPPAGCGPTPLDNVFFDGNSFSSSLQAVAITANTAYCRNMSWSGVLDLPNFTCAFPAYLKIFGSLDLVTAMDMHFNGHTYFEATIPGQTITMAGKSFVGETVFNGIGGEWKLLDTFTTLSWLSLNSGILTTNNNTVNVSQFISVSLFARTLNMGSSVFNISSPYLSWWTNTNVNTPNLILNSGTSIINCTGDGVDFEGGGLTYYDLNCTRASAIYPATISDNNTFHNIFFAATGYIIHSNTIHNASFNGDGQIEANNSFDELNFTAGHTYTLWSGSTQTVNGRWQIQGYCTLYIVLKSSTQGAFASVTKPAGTVPGYDIHIKDIHCTGAANFIAYNSVDLGGNTGWNFTTLPPLQNPGIVTGPVQVCGGATGVVYHIPPVPGAIGYLWTVPAGAVITSGQGDTLITVDFGTAVSGNITVQSFNGCNYGTISSALPVVAGSGTPAPVLNVQPVGPVCAGTTVTFTATSFNSATYNYKVNGNSVQSGPSNIFSTTALANADAVSCSITITGSGCTASGTFETNTVHMGVNPNPVISFDPPAATIFSGSSVQLTANSTVSIGSYLWSPAAGLNDPSIFNPVASPTATTEYHLQVVSVDHCVADNRMTVTVLPAKNCSLIVPNAFTPNGDGINDRWVITHENCIRKVVVSVYNRYGSLVYHSDDYQSDWQGLYQSKPCPDGTYYYVMKAYYYDLDNRVLRGDLTILR